MPNPMFSDSIDHLLFDDGGSATTGQIPPAYDIGYECAYPHLAEEVSFLIIDGDDLAFTRIPAQRAYL